MPVYMIKAEGSIRGAAHGSLDAAKKAANGYLLGRSAVRLVDILEMISGLPPAGWPVVLSAVRKRRGGAITFVSVVSGQ